MNREFSFTDMYYLNEGMDETQAQLQYLYSENLDAINRNSFVEVINDADDSVIFTLAKFVEIIDNLGLEGLVSL